MLKRFLNFAIAMSFVVLTSFTAHATPPRYANVHDTPIGISQTHMFLFRVLSDNEGSHYITATQRFLIAQDLRTGKVDQIWLIDKTRRVDVEPDNPVVEYHRAAPKTDPIAVLASHFAVPLTLTAHTDWQDDRVIPADGFVLEDEGIIHQSSSEPRLAVKATDITARVNASMNPFLDKLEDDPSWVDPITFDKHAYTHSFADCIVIGMAANISGFNVFRIECENGEFEVLSYKIYLTVPRPD